jgi:hypothetical protein
MTYQPMATLCDRAGGLTRNSALNGEYQASAMIARLIGAAIAPPRSAKRERATQAAAATMIAAHPMSWAISA